MMNADVGPKPSLGGRFIAGGSANARATVFDLAFKSEVTKHRTKINALQTGSSSPNQCKLGHVA
jgi:hypothetical protein